MPTSKEVEIVIAQRNMHEYMIINKTEHEIRVLEEIAWILLAIICAMSDCGTCEVKKHCDRISNF